MKTTFRISLLITLLFSSCVINASEQNDPTGTWQTPRSILKIYNTNGELRANVVKILNNKLPSFPLCKNCPEKFQNKPIIGMTVIWGLKKQNNNNWGDGQALDPESGKIYNATLELSKDGKTINFHASKSFFGRTIEWRRLK